MGVNIRPAEPRDAAAVVAMAAELSADQGKPPRGAQFACVSNVGVRPTLEKQGRCLAEAHLLDFEGEIYGRRVELCFVHQLRAERRFPSLHALREQIAADVAEARRRLEWH